MHMCSKIITFVFHSSHTIPNSFHMRLIFSPNSNSVHTTPVKPNALRTSHFAPFTRLRWRTSETRHRCETMPVCVIFGVTFTRYRRDIMAHRINKSYDITRRFICRGNQRKVNHNHMQSEVLDLDHLSQPF